VRTESHAGAPQTPTTVVTDRATVCSRVARTALNSKLSRLNPKSTLQVEVRPVVEMGAQATAATA